MKTSKYLFCKQKISLKPAECNSIKVEQKQTEWKTKFNFPSKLKCFPCHRILVESANISCLIKTSIISRKRAPDVHCQVGSTAANPQDFLALSSRAKSRRLVGWWVKVSEEIEEGAFLKLYPILFSCQLSFTPLFNTGPFFCQSSNNGGGVKLF